MACRDESNIAERQSVALSGWFGEGISADPLTAMGLLKSAAQNLSRFHSTGSSRHIAAVHDCQLSGSPVQCGKETSVVGPQGVQWPQNQQMNMPLLRRRPRQVPD